MLENIPKKEKAIKLRREGKTYSEILKEVLVAKSTLSEWFREVKLSVPEKQRLTEKKLIAARRGGIAKHNQRLKRVEEIRQKALLDIKHISKRELWLIGTALYWAEGTKEKDFRPGTGINFNNSDPRMIKIFIKWLIECLGVTNDRISLEIYLHESSVNSVDKCKKYWSDVTAFHVSKFNKVYFKRFRKKTTRKNIGELYYGLLRVRVSASSSLLRLISGWTSAIASRIK